MRCLPAATLVVLSLLAAAPAAADPPASARQLYAAGSAHFRAGRIKQAIAAFEHGHRLAPRPEFLLNLSQCYRALGQRARAIAYLQRFVLAAPAHPLRAAAEHTLAELSAPERAAPRPVRAASAAQQPPPSTTPLLLREQIAELPGPPPTPPAPRRRRSRAWRWVLLGVGVAAAAAGIAVGAYYGSHGEEPAELGTLRLPTP